MINIILAFVILGIAMFFSIKIVDFAFFVGRFSNNPEEIQNKSWWERMIEATFEYLQWANFSTSNINAVHSINAYEVELGSVCSEVSANVEGIEEGVSAIAESMGEHIVTAIESLFNN